MKTLFPLFVAALLAVVTIESFAQPAARITSIAAYRDQPEARLRLHVVCDSVPYYELTASMLSFQDNGMLVTEYSIETYAAAAAHKDFTAMLVLDRSGSMMGNPISELRTACHELVTFMDSTADEIGMILFNDQVTLHQTFTSSPFLLRDRIDQIPASGATAVWDGAYAGVQMLAAHQGNSSRAVLLMTDGADNSSTRKPFEVIALALQQNIRIFTVALGSTGLPTDTLEHIAHTTGGLYFQTPNPADLTTIFLTIASLTRRDFDEYTIRFTTPDPGAAEHKLEAVVSACDGIASAQITRPVMDGVVSREAVPSPSSNLVKLNPISPNPVAGGIARLSFSVAANAVTRDARIMVMDILGRETGVSQFIPANAGENATMLDLSGLAPGIYQVRLITGNIAAGTPLVIAR